MTVDDLNSARAHALAHLQRARKGNRAPQSVSHSLSSRELQCCHRNVTLMCRVTVAMFVGAVRSSPCVTLVSNNEVNFVLSFNEVNFVKHQFYS